MLKPTNRPRMLIPGTVGGVSYRVHHDGLTVLEQEDGEEPGKVTLLSIEAAEFCKVIGTGELAGLPAMSYELEPGTRLVRRGTSAWSIERGRRRFNRSRQWLTGGWSITGGDMGTEWPTAEAAFDFWKAREKP